MLHSLFLIKIDMLHVMFMFYFYMIWKLCTAIPVKLLFIKKNSYLTLKNIIIFYGKVQCKYFTWKVYVLPWYESLRNLTV